MCVCVYCCFCVCMRHFTDTAHNGCHIKQDNVSDVACHFNMESGYGVVYNTTFLVREWCAVSKFAPVLILAVGCYV